MNICLKQAQTNELVIKALIFQKHTSFEMRKIFDIFLTNCTNSSKFKLSDDIPYQIFEQYLQTLADAIKDPDEAWLKDISFDKMCKKISYYHIKLHIK